MKLLLIITEFQIAINCFLIFTATLIVTRIAGLRTFAKMSSIDFASTIAIGSIIASTIVSSSVSITNGALALLLIVVFQISVARLTKRFSWFNNLVSNQPILLMYEGAIIDKNLDRSGVSVNDLMAKLREANAIQLSNVKAVVFETTGDVSVLHTSDNLVLDEKILQGVEDLKG